MTDKQKNKQMKRIYKLNPAHHVPQDQNIINSIRKLHLVQFISYAT